MSFDVFFQGFDSGNARVGGDDRMRDVLAPHIVRTEAHNFALVQIGDGKADVYLSDSSMMANHIEGHDPWDLLVRGAHAANWVIMPVGSPTCLTREEQGLDLPEPLNEDYVLVRTGADLIRAIGAH